ncbi:hypothetical protein FV139_15040 [Parahaliea maris]|uniref:VOC domain-containing protein n=1 Tax=Parahaliea maris TaxID=2716870 RepID=A0A5C8ZW05_9GAMM|nr:VOC family protein [Parahaliea maris]TXS92039.1 hypothetical protein FV139_15040 [Parahaliea maris]
MEQRELQLSSLIRATIFVRNLEKATAFYRALGFEETYLDMVLDHPSASQVIGLPQHHPYPARILKQPGPNFGMLGLFELSPAQGAAEVDRGDGAARIGEVALVFYVRSLERTLPLLERAGARWMPDPQTFQMGDFSVRETCVRDCDGTLLSLIERPPEDQLRTTPPPVS